MLLPKAKAKAFLRAVPVLQRILPIERQHVLLLTELEKCPKRATGALPLQDIGNLNIPLPVAVTKPLPSKVVPLLPKSITPQIPLLQQLKQGRLTLNLNLAGHLHLLPLTNG